MLQKKPVCTGAATGYQCKHYWLRFAPVVANNPDMVRDGERGRACLLSEAFLPEFDSQDTPTYCNRYEPRPAPGLVNIVRRALGAGGFVPYARDKEEYNPLTPEQIRELQEASPSTPEEYSPPVPVVSVADIARVQTANMGPAPSPKPGDSTQEEIDAVLASLTENKKEGEK